MILNLNSLKLFFLTSILAVAVVMVSGSFYIRNTSAFLTARFSLPVHLAFANANYWVRYDLPQQGTLLAASVGLANMPVVPAPAAATSTTAQGIPILLYHGEGPAADMPASVFVAQLEALKAAGWHTVTLAQYEAFIQGTLALPAKSFLLTFDDGRRDTFYAADPVLKALGFHAVMFVITGFSLPQNGSTAINDFYLSKPELAFMAASGRWDLESHGDEDHRLYSVPDATSTLTDATQIADGHFLSDKFWLPADNRVETTAEFTARVTADLQDSKNILEEDFGAPVTAFAYPLNDFGEDSVNFPQSENILNQVVPSLYAYAFYQTWSGNGDLFNYPNPGAYLVKRFEPEADWTGADLLQYLDADAPKELPYASTDFTDGWDAAWGLASASQNALSLAAASSTTGASTYLEGSETWSNYDVSATADAKVGTLSLIARQTEIAAPYFVCAFSENRIYLEQHVGSTQTTLASALYAPPAEPAFWNVSMSVENNVASCSAYGVSVEAADSAIPARGGVGVSVWDPEAGTAAVSLTHLSVTPL